MRSTVFRLLNNLKDNTTNTISFYKSNKRYEKTFSDFFSDVDRTISKLNYLRNTEGVTNVAILGPISYDWIVCDIACIKGGYLSIAIPEILSGDNINNIIEETKADVVLMDFCFADKFNKIKSKVFHIGCDDNAIVTDLYQLPGDEISHENLILREYSIAFSSGTSEKIKYIKRTFPDIQKTQETFIARLRKKIRIFKYKRSFWIRKDNKLIIFMAFSHPQQRDFFQTALFRKINIVLSDQKNCLKHIILEKPNIMISVPAIYEVMANGIKSKVQKFNSAQKILYKIFNTTRINALSNRSYIKRIFSFFLFKEIKKIYGGKADFFVTGSAPISPEVMRTFYSVGIKLLQAYGQSETGIIAMNTPENFKIGSVGKPSMKVKISEDSEILVQYNKENHSANQDVLAIDRDNFIHTGDLGYLDKKGFLFIIGRKDDVIVLENGEKVFPEKIEAIIKNSEVVKDACLFAKGGTKLYAVIDCVVKVKEQEIKDLILAANDKLPKYERISAFYLTENPFSSENGFLTSTLKKRRASIQKHFLDKDFIAV